MMPNTRDNNNCTITFPSSYTTKDTYQGFACGYGSETYATIYDKKATQCKVHVPGGDKNRSWLTIGY